jgi:DtxR family Mn-dependent transcriptional regulator
MTGPYPDPAASLLVFAVLALLTAAIAWPRRGIAARMRRAVQLSERVRLEDGVKHLLTSELARRASSVESLAGAIDVSRDRAVEIVRHLERLGLARLTDGDIVLTDEGRAHALRIVRTHRLWERYLADSTDVDPEDWHAQAERLEHSLAPADVERLAASLDHPVYDPHGDPIPTAGGDLPPARGTALSSLPEGAAARVVHVEDEPEEIYRSLRASGIDVGTRLRVRHVDPTILHLSVDGRDVALDALAVRNLTVEPVEDDTAEEGLERLDVLQPGESGVVALVSGRVRGAQRRRLLDLGVVEGTVIRAELRSLSGDPVAYRIRGAVIALRRAQARDILIRRLSREEAA